MQLLFHDSSLEGSKHLLIGLSVEPCLIPNARLFFLLLLSDGVELFMLL